MRCTISYTSRCSSSMLQRLQLLSLRSDRVLLFEWLLSCSVGPPASDSDALSCTAPPPTVWKEPSHGSASLSPSLEALLHFQGPGVLIGSWKAANCVKQNRFPEPVLTDFLINQQISFQVTYFKRKTQFLQRKGLWNLFNLNMFNLHLTKLKNPWKYQCICIVLIFRLHISAYSLWSDTMKLGWFFCSNNPGLHR